MVENGGRIDEMANPDINNSELESVSGFAENNKITAEDNGRECVDGRYDQAGVEKGFIALPGADFGFVMALLTLKKDGEGSSAKDIVDLVYNATMENNGYFYMHSDTHALNEGKLTGCGHIQKATENEHAVKYGVNPEEVREALLYARDKAQHSNTQEAELSGEHEERDVIIVDSNTHTLNHKGKDGEQHFVWDRQRSKDYARKLFKKLDIEGITEDEFLDILENQTMTTVGILAKGKNVYETNLIGEKPKVSFVMEVK